MAETVTTGQTQGSSYTWASPAIVWNDGRASYKTWAIAYDISYTASISSSLAFIESRSGEISKPVSDALALSELRVGAISKSVSDALALSELRVGEISKSVSDALALSELRVGEISKSVSDALALLDQSSVIAEKSIAESALVDEAMGRTATFIRVVSESAAAVESISKASALVKSDTLALSDQQGIAAGKFIAESALVGEAMGRTAEFSRAVSEGISTAESISKASALAKSNSIAIGDELRRNANAVISDILIGSSDMTQAQFDAELLSGSAPGFAQFRRFIDGDYEYKDAIFKGILASSDAALPRITALEVSIDVPDVYDRGTALTSSSAVVTVTCARKFYVIPEVVATCKGGTVIAVPRISNIQISAVGVATFDIELIDSGNNRVAGTLSWSAHGY